MARRNPARLTSLEQRLISLHTFVENNAYIFSRRKSSKKAYKILPCPQFSPWPEKTFEEKETAATTTTTKGPEARDPYLCACSTCGNYGAEVFSSPFFDTFDNSVRWYIRCSFCPPDPALLDEPSRPASSGRNRAIAATKTSQSLPAVLHLFAAPTQQQRGALGTQMAHAGKI
jgi:hypothetical protein